MTYSIIFLSEYTDLPSHSIFYGGDFLKIQWKELIICIAIPLAVGGLASFLTEDSMQTFAMIEKPPLAPPAWLFPVVWTILYVLMGIASYIVYTSDKSSQVSTALKVYGLQLAFNFFWSIIFFNLENYLLAFVWLVALWILILLTNRLFDKISDTAGYLILPYLLWVTFAGYLNWGIYLLN